MPNRNVHTALGMNVGSELNYMHVKMKGYRGSKDAARLKVIRRNQLALKVESYLNERLSSCPDEIQIFLYHEIADALGANVREIREILSHHGGYNGVTRGKPHESSAGQGQ